MPDAIASARHVTKQFGAKTALDGVSVDVLPGDIIGVLGKNGAGKTTLPETLLGFSPPDRGSIAVFGEDALAMSAAAKARIGFLPQQEEVFAMLTGERRLLPFTSFAWPLATAMLLFGKTTAIMHSSRMLGGVSH